jgi:hypothetical protein
MKTLIKIIISLIFAVLFFNGAWSQEITSSGKKIWINNLPALNIISVGLVDANNNKLVEAEENCYLEIVIKNSGNGIGRTVNLDVSLDTPPVKGFSFKNSIYAGNLVDGKEYTFQVELYPSVTMAAGMARLKIEALEGNAYNSKPKYINLNLKANQNSEAIGWLNPMPESVTTYEPNFTIRNCIVSPFAVNEAKVYLNGEVYSDFRGMKLVKSEDCDYELETLLKLRPGINRVYVEIATKNGTKKSETKSITFSEMMTENRHALIIGNSKYAVAPLRNAVNDAKAMAKALRELNFDVIEVTDGDKKMMKDAVREFSAKLTEHKGVGLFYYAGHGVQVKGENYLIPINHNIQAEPDVEDEAVRVNLILDYMQSCGTRMNIVILDACRDNPFARSMRSGTRGLAQVYAEGSGSIISYATSPGSVAADGEGENGLYTQELLKAIQTPGLEIERIFRTTLANVKKLSGNNQIPWYNASIEGEFYFKK